ncbi:MAG: hypothetical protein M3Y77_10465 [Actinomycetota bacterium]|nr:hypothetical protein [Actinomycetota bacterium]
MTGSESLIEAFDLPDLDDRHVLAAAVRCGAELLVTENLRDFPSGELEKYGVQAKSADDFLVDQFYIDPGALQAIVEQLSASWKGIRRRMRVFGRIERTGLLQLAALLRKRQS